MAGTPVVTPFRRRCGTAVSARRLARLAPRECRMLFGSAGGASRSARSRSQAVRSNTRKRLAGRSRSRRVGGSPTIRRARAQGVPADRAMPDAAQHVMANPCPMPCIEGRKHRNRGRVILRSAPLPHGPLAESCERQAVARGDSTRERPACEKLRVMGTACAIRTQA